MECLTCKGYVVVQVGLCKYRGFTTVIATIVVAVCTLGVARGIGGKVALDHVAGSGVLQRGLARRTLECGGSFTNFGSGPVRPGKLIAVNPILPARVLALVRFATAIGVTRAPFGNEYGKACVDCLLCISAFASGSPRGLSAPTVRIGVIMECVGDVFARNCIADGFLRILVVLPVADKNQVVGMLTDDGNDFFGISLDLVPGCRYGFVIKFKDDVVVLTPFLGHFGKELGGVVNFGVCLVRMPVNNDVNVVFDSGLYDSVHEVRLEFRVGCVAGDVLGLVVAAAFRTVLTAPPVIGCGCHGGTHDLNIHVADHSGNAFGCPEFRCLWQKAPIKAHAAYLDFGTVLDAFAAAVNTAFALRVLAGHELTVLADRAHAGGGDVLGYSKRGT